MNFLKFILEQALRICIHRYVSTGLQVKFKRQAQVEVNEHYETKANIASNITEVYSINCCLKCNTLKLKSQRLYRNI